MLTVIIPYKENKTALAQLLVSLQPQLHPDDDIYIIDGSPDRSGVEVAKQYGSTRCYIFVEVVDPKEFSVPDAIPFGLQSMKQNSHAASLIFPYLCVIPNTLVANTKKLIKEDYGSILILGLRSPEMNSNFKWFTPKPVVKPLVPDMEDVDGQDEIGAIIIKSQSVNNDGSVLPIVEIKSAYVSSEYIHVITK